jgi:antirestriction protein ArdC
MAKPNRIDVYERVNAKLVEMMEAGAIPWQRAWSGGGRAANLISKKPYRGINALLLGFAPYGSPWFVSFKQARDLGGNVRKGEKGNLAIFWKRLEFDEKGKDGRMGKKIVPLLRHYHVFNVDQCEGIPAEKIPGGESPALDFKPIAEAEKVVAAMPESPRIDHSGRRAFYSPLEDFVNMPGRDSFTSEEAYYSVLFHELAHSTGHSSRIDRGLDSTLAAFGSPDYSKEELVAEIASAFVCGSLGIEETTLRNSAAYLQGWLRALKDDKKLLVAAAGKAQRAADWILNNREVPA